MEESAEKKQFLKMTETPVSALIISLAIPTVITMLTSSFTIWQILFCFSNRNKCSATVGRFSLMAIIQAVGFTIEWVREHYFKTTRRCDVEHF